MIDDPAPDDAAPLRAPDARMIPAWEPGQGNPQDVWPPRPTTRRPEQRSGPAPPGAVLGSTPPDPSTDSAGDDLVVRPFLLTGGRTEPARTDLNVESLILATPGSLTSANTGKLRFEHRRIVELCREATSMAELAAALRAPLGVTRVLVSDLIADGAVQLVHSDELSIQMIERIRDRVRAL